MLVDGTIHGPMEILTVMDGTMDGILGATVTEPHMDMDTRTDTDGATRGGLGTTGGITEITVGILGITPLRVLEPTMADEDLLNTPPHVETLLQREELERLPGRPLEHRTVVSKN